MKIKDVKDDIKSVVYSGCFIEKNGVSICNIKNYTSGPTQKQFGSRFGKYQVWSDKHRAFELYHNIEEAVNKFVNLVSKR